MDSCDEFRVAYVSGPIDAPRVYDEWRRGEKSPGYYGTVYLAQLLSILEDMNAYSLVITTRKAPFSRELKERFLFINRPLPRNRKGIFYHIAMIFWSMQCMRDVIQFKANAALLTEGQNYFWVFRPLRLFGIRLVASLHCTIWPKLAPRKFVHRVFDWLNGNVFFPACDHIQGVSDEAVNQVRSVSSSLHAPPKRFIATYEPERFAEVVKPVWPDSDIFELLYVGRLTKNKGVLDLVEIMEVLEKTTPGKFRLTICGEGAARAELSSSIEKAGMQGVVHLRGHCAASELAVLFSKAHAVVIPTRSDFEEGTPKVAFEAVLNMRPLVMSAACPALSDVFRATEEAKVDSPADYVAAIRRLANSRDLYYERVDGAISCRGQHFNLMRSYGAVLRPSLERIAERTRV